MIDDPQFGTRLHALEVRVRRIENQLAQEQPCNESAVSPAACCAGAGGTGGSGTGRSGMTPVPITPADGVDSAQKHTGSVSSAGNGGDCGHSATSPTCAAAAAAFDPDAVERHKFTSIYEVSGKREHTHIMECVDATDYDQLHLLYNESEAARVRQMRTIDDLTRERDALAAECGAIRRRRRAVEANNAAIGSEAIEQTEKEIIEACRAYEAAIEATNALPGMRERLEGQG